MYYDVNKDRINCIVCLKNEAAADNKCDPRTNERSRTGRVELVSSTTIITITTSIQQPTTSVTDATVHSQLKSRAVASNRSIN